MSLVDHAIEIGSSASWLELDPHFQRLADPTNGRYGHLIEPTVLDTPDRGSRHAGSLGQVILAPTSLDARRADRHPEALVVHGRIVTMGTQRRLIWPDREPPPTGYTGRPRQMPALGALGVLAREVTDSDARNRPIRVKMPVKRARDANLAPRRRPTLRWRASVGSTTKQNTRSVYDAWKRRGQGHLRSCTTADPAVDRWRRNVDERPRNVETTRTAEPPHLAHKARNEPQHLVVSGLTAPPHAGIVHGVARSTETRPDTLPPTPPVGPEHAPRNSAKQTTGNEAVATAKDTARREADGPSQRQCGPGH